MFKDENRHYGLRKLSVGLASVLIGISFASSMNSNSVKADSLNKVPVYLRGNENTVRNETQQFSSVQNSVALGKQKASTQSGDQVEAQENRLVNQINYKLTNNSSTDSKEDLGQNKVAPDETKSTSTTKSDAEKSIVSPSSAQKINNQSNDHAEDNSQSQLNITKNSQPLDEKALATNLIQDNKSADDLATQKDPSKLNANDFAAGTKWTTAGWTRTNPQYVAKSSKMTLNISNNKLNSKLLSPTYIDFDVDFTIDKNELSKNRSFLVGSIQTTFYNRSQSQTDPDFDNKAGLYAGFDYHNFTTGNNDIISDNQKLGHLIYGNNGSEADLYFVSDIDKSDAVDDITVHYQTKTGTISLDWFNNPDYRDFAKNGFTKYPIIQNIITNSDIYQNTISTDSTVTYPINPDIYESWYLDGSWDVYGHQFGKYNDTPIQYVLKVKSTDPIANTYHTDIWRNYFFFNKDNQMTSQSTGISIALKRVDKGHNLTALDLMNQTKFGESAISWQSDGSYLVCVKYDPNSDAGININDLRSAVEKSYLANIGDPTHKQQIIDNTVNYYSNNKRFYNTYAVKSTFTADETQPHTVFVTDVTPNQTASSTQTVEHIVNGITNIVGETYRHVNLSYIDDVTNKSISTDVLTGRKGQNLEYTITIPKNYLLVTPTDGTNYKWNTDHTKITYTFADDQTLNEKNPIVIHLKHKIQDVSATDPNAKQNNRYRMIENLPDGTKKTLIDLEIESHRTATKDLVTGKTTYSDWISKDAVFTNRTNNGAAGDPSFIWKVPLDWFDNCTRTFSIPNGYEKVEQNDHTFYTSPEKDNHGASLIYFISYPDGGVGLDFEFGISINNTTTYKAMPANCDFVINYQHNTQKVTDPSQLQTTGKRTITIKMPKGHGDQMTIVQTVGYKRTGSLDLYTGKATYTDWVFDADTSNVTVDGQPSTQYQAYVLKDGVVNYAPIKLPHINGYKTKLIQDKANPAMFMVSFVALPQQNNQSNNVQSSQKNTQAEQKQPEPIQTKPAKQETLDVIVVHMPDGTTKTYVQTIGFVNNIDEDLVTNNITNIYTVDASKSNTTVNGTVDSNIQAYRKTGNDDATGTNYKFASFVLPKVPGYKAYIKPVSINPNMRLFSVSFMALPKPVVPAINDAKPTKTVTPVATEAAELIKTEPKVDTTPKVIDLSNDAVAIAPKEATWQVANEPERDTYHVSNGKYTVELPHINNAQLHVLANNSTKDSVLFTYKGQNTKYVFNIKFVNGHYLLTTYEIKSGKLVKLIDYNFIKSSKMIDVILDWLQLR